MGWPPSIALLLLSVLAASSGTANANQDCYGSVGGANGHIYQFDGGRVSTFPCGCQFLLARTSKFELLASFGDAETGKHHHQRRGLSRLRSLTVKVGGKVLQLLSGRRLSVSKKLVNVPHSEHDIRVFYSGEDIVLVHKKLDFWVAFDGESVGTFRLGSRYRRRVSGLAGNCDGRRQNDQFGNLAKAFKLWKHKGWVQGCTRQPKERRCHSSEEEHEAKKACRKVIQGSGRCPSTDVLQPCIIDYCATRYRPDLRKEFLCASFYLHSRRCARHHRPLAWRHTSGCPLACGHHQHFSRKANPCPKTCENHFFGTRRNCFKLPSAEGCRCNQGYVLDGSRCVKPKHCVCLASLCINRVSTNKCRRWRAQGRCRRYPEVMSRFCRLTCGMCRPHCRNQISSLLCRQLKQWGKCRKSFYRMMCRATCQPKKCGCPPKRRVVSKCTIKYQNKAVTTLQWFPDVAGRCRKSVLIRYMPCGFCRFRSKTTWGKCNYCKGVQLGQRLLQYREEYGKRRCILRVYTVRRSCYCPPIGHPKSVTHVKCLGDVLKVQITKTYVAAKRCSRCVRITKQTVLQKLSCSGYFYTGKCKPGLNHITRKKFQRYAQRCQCKVRLVEQRKMMCRCDKPVSRTVCKGDHYLTVTTSWTLRNGRCVRRLEQSKSYLRCDRRPRTWETCQRRDCKAFGHESHFSLYGCKCRMSQTNKHLGKCCCPPGFKRIERVNRYWKRLIIVTYVLKNYKCYRVTRVIKIRIACPRGRQFVQCEGRRGHRIYVKEWFVKSGNRCIKKVETRTEQIKCRRDVKRVLGPCHLLYGTIRYRKVEYHFFQRRPGTCVCEPGLRTQKEMCGCREGKFPRVTRCPSGCSAKSCGDHCSFAKEFFFYQIYGKHCRENVFKRQFFRCCCRRDERVKVWCQDNHFSMREVSYSVLKSHKCHRVHNTSSKRITCRRNSETKRLRHPKKGFYYLATFTWFVLNCKCRVRVTKRVCKKRCAKPTQRHYCDTVRRHLVTSRTTWSLRGCDQCVRHVEEQRVPVCCSRAEKRWQVCNKSSGVLTQYKQWWKQVGCTCILRKSSKRLRCKCPKPVIGPRRCNSGRHAFERQTTYWVLVNGECVRRRRTVTTQLTCSRLVKYKTVCIRKSGIKVVYIGVLRPKKCKCVLVWSVHDRRKRCNCNWENKRVKGVVRYFCDRNRNLKGVERFYFVLRDGRCLKRSRKSYRSFRCPHAYVEKLDCNERKHRQLLLTHYSVKRNCRCVRLIKQSYRKCGCLGKRKEHTRFCHKVLGTIVRTVITRRWCSRRHQCVTTKKSTSHRVLCRIKTVYTTSKCRKNKYYIETKIFFVRKACKCVRKQEKRKRNCHCKNIIRRYKCPKQGFTRRVVTEIRRWDMKKQRCRTHRYVTHHIRCRCPKGYRRRYCKAGHWVKETVRFILRNARCYKKVETRSRRVSCPRIVRNRYTACRGCYRFHYTLEQRLRPSRCNCYFAVVRKRRCPCCCPKNYNKRHCVRDDQWEHVFTHYAAYTGHRCGCRQWVTRRQEKVHCSSKRSFRWLKCDRRSCLSHQEVTYHQADRCHCRKKQHLTGQKRTCCCLIPPRTSRICKHSSVYEVQVFYQLIRWHCVRQSTERLLHRWECNGKPIVVIGRCNRSTCQQPVHTLVDVVSRPHCRCHRVVQNRYTRPCCCLKRPYHTTRCERNCWVHRSTRYSFDKRRRVCVAHNSRQRSCISCQRPQQIIDRCNTRTCLQRITYITHLLDDCQCKKRTDFVHRVCCCPRPSVSGPQCIRHNELLWLTTSWNLSFGRCMKQVTETRQRVFCRQGVTVVLACNRKTCLQRVRHENVYVHHCGCRSKWRDTHQTCCCRPEVITNTRCEGDRFVFLYKTTRTLNRFRVCVSHTTKQLVYQVTGCNTYERRSVCNKRTGYVTVTVFHQRPKNCGCEVYRKTVRLVLCTCPSPRELVSKCNQRTCHLDVLNEWFTSHGTGDNFKCERHQRVTHLRCCCHRNPRQKTFCDQRTGAIKILHTWTVFQSRSRTCSLEHSEQLVRNLVCPKTDCRTGRCNKKTGFQVRVCDHFSEDRRHCTCQKRVTQEKIVCSCPKGYRQSFCEGHNKRVTVHTYWRLSRRLNMCIRVVKREVKYLNCSNKCRTVRKCRGCRGIVYTHQFRLRKCRCVRKTQSHPVLCCCPKTRRTKRCLGSRWDFKKVSFKLRKERCAKFVYHKHVTVACKSKITKYSKCRGCIRRKETLYYRVRDCKCRVSRRSVRTSHCCCPKNRRYVQCIGGVFKTVREYWRLHLGKCLKKLQVSAKPVRCKRKSIKAFACNQETRLQKVIVTKHTRRGCSCTSHRRVHYVRCKCRHPIIKAEKCRHRSSKRRVFKISYELILHDVENEENNECRPIKKLLYWEPCRCRKSQKIYKCSSEGNVLITTVRRWYLAKRNGHHVCALKVSVLYTAVHCKGKSISWSKCSHFHKTRTIIRHRPVHCKCKRFVTKDVFICNCHKKSFKRRFCDHKRGAIVVEKRSYFSHPGATKCSFVSRRAYEPVSCSHRVRTTRISSKCGVYHHYGWYSKYLITSQVRHGCKCVRRQRTVTKLCRCKSNWQQAKCSRGGRHIVTIIHTYKRIGSVCYLTRTEKRQPVVCRSTRPSVRFYGCERCRRQVSLSQCYVSACRLRSFLRSGLQLCCTPPVKKRHYCDVRNGRWVTEITTYRLVPSGPLLTDINGRVLVPQLKVVSSTSSTYVRVTCPRSHLQEHCNRNSGKWRKSLTTWSRVGCHCKKRTQRWSGECRCPPRQIRWSHCHKRYRTKTVIYFDLKQHRCIRREQRRTYLCACPKPREFTVCDRRGHWKTCRVRHLLQFRRQRCVVEQDCRRRPHLCPAPYETLGRCIHFSRIIKRHVTILNKKKCKCVPTVYTRRADCDCHKRHSSHTVCKYGAFVTTAIHYTQRGERCVRHVKTIIKPVYCDGRHRSRIIRGSCVLARHNPHRGYQQLLTEWKVNHKCRCERRHTISWVPCVCHLIERFRTRKFVKCIRGSVFLYTTVYFQLVHGQCVKRVKRREQKINCLGSKDLRGKCKPNRHGDTFAVTRKYHLVSDGRCGCIWKQKSLHYQVCRCRRNHYSKRCIHDRVWHSEDFSYTPVPESQGCREHVRRHDVHVYCPSDFVKRSRCIRCGFTVQHFTYRHVNCKCVVRLQRVQHLKCCCSPPVTKHSCDASRHLKVAVTISYILKNHACHPKTTVTTQRVHCGRKRPLYRISVCRKGFRTISKTVHFAYACGCRAKTSIYRQRCACSRARIYQPGKCGRWFAYDVWLAFKLQPTGKRIPGTNQPLNKCVRYVSDRVKRRCRCPNGYKKHLCLSDNTNVDITVSYYLHGNSCQRKRVERRHTLGCSRKPHLVRVETVPQKCSKRYGYEQVIKYIYVHANKCRCEYSTRLRRRVCDCLRKFGRHFKTQCVQHTRLVTRETWYVQHKDGCAPRHRDTEQVVHCRGERLEHSKCHRNGIRVFTIYKQYAHNCKCVWKKVRHVNVPCRCRKSETSKQCLANQWVTVTKSWELVGHGLNAHCKLVKRVQRRRVPCKIGRHVQKSRCDFRGVRRFVTTVRSIRKCRCIKSITSRSCRCRCPKPSTQRYCRDSAVWVTVKTKSLLNKCACYSKVDISRKLVRCPKSRLVRGQCKRGQNGDKYQKLTYIRWVVKRCKCRRVRSTRHLLCGCDRRRRVSHLCLAGILRVVKTTERRFTCGGCQRVLVHRRQIRVRCGRQTVKRICHKSSGLLSIFVIRPSVKRCRCIRKVTRHSRRCGCHGGTKLVSVGRCNRSTCRQRLLFKKQVLDDEMCVWRKFHRQRVCCCKGYRSTTNCRSGFLVTTITKRVLQHWHCVKKVVQSSKKVKCKRSLTVRKRKLSDGVLKVVSCWKVRRGCDCVKRCKTVFRRYKCKKPVQQTVCKCSHGRCHYRTCVISWRLSHGLCLRSSSRSRRPVVCKPNTSYRSRCNRPTKFGFYYVENAVSWYQKACRCYRRSRTRSVVCRCLKPHSETSCERGHIVKVYVSYRLSRGSCVKVVKRTSQAVRCRHSWRLAYQTSGIPVFYKVFERFVRSGCECIRQTKRVPCYSRCPPCTVAKTCDRHSEKVRVETCWHLVGCNCVRRVRTTRQHVRCPKLPIKSTCQGCVRTVVTRDHNVHKCACSVTTKVFKSKCCCPGPSVTKACVSGSIRLRHITHRLQNGRCYSYTKDVFKPVSCSRHVLRAIRSKCKRGKQKYSVRYWVKLGCRCVRRVRFEFRKCVCAHKAVELYFVVDFYGKERHVTYEQRVKAFLGTVAKYFIHTSAKVSATLIGYNWNWFEQKLKDIRNIKFDTLTRTKTDLYGALREVNTRLQRRSKSGVEKIVIIISCGRHANQRKAIMIADKIKRRATVFVVGFRPIPRTGLFIKWLASKPVKRHYMELGIYRKYRVSATRLFERICEEACAKPVIQRSVCHRDNCRQVFTRVTFQFDQRRKTCVRKTSSWWRLCCCVERDRSFTECHRNRLFHVTITHRFHDHTCHRREHRKDISAQIYTVCRPHVLEKRGPCRRDGWRRVTTETRQVIDCRCKVSALHRLVRCSCPKPFVRSVCQRDNSVRHCRISYRLTPSACIAQQSCYSTRSTCKPPSIVKGKCDKFSCYREVGKVWHSLQDCQCKRYFLNWREVCCCKRQYQKVRFCDKWKHQHVEVESWFEFHGIGCRRVTRNTVHPVKCPTSRVEYTKCVAMRDGFYRSRLEHHWSKKDCGCIKNTRSYLELCRCRRGSTVRQCLSGYWILTHHWLKKIGNMCVPRSKVVLRERVTCSSTRQKHTGRCHHRRGDHLYARVVLTWKRRVGCACKTAHSVTYKLCACPKPFVRYSCLGDSRRVETVYRYRLHGNGCKLLKSSTYTLIRCPNATTKVAKCRGKTQAVVVILHRARRCKCVSKVYRRLVRCKSKCRDLLPTGICRKWAANKIQLCDKYPYFAKQLCPKTCHVCFSCTKTRILYSGELCLSRQRGFQQKFILAKYSSMKRCVKSCRNAKDCRAIDYDHSTGKCQLLKLNREGFIMRNPWHKLRQTPGCILFERICPKKCLFRRIIKGYKCRCVSFGKHHSLCYRTAAVATWKRGRQGKCVRRVQKVDIPCRRCEDKGAWCKKSLCSKHLVRSLCNYTCGVCKRKPKYFHHLGRCSKTGWVTEVWGRLYYDTEMHLWRVKITTTRKRCARCPVGVYRLVGRCKNGKRKLTTVVARYSHGKCRVTARAKLLSCKGCVLSRRTLVGECKRHGSRWTRKVVTYFTVRLATRCVVRKILVVYGCSPRCPRDLVSRSPCKCGRRIRCVHFYITYPGSKFCIPKKYTTSERCEATIKCEDKLHLSECLFIKKNNMCKSMKAWCPRSCGLCR